MELVQVIVDAEMGPATFAVPVQTVPSEAVPENLNWPSKEAPWTAPLICPDQLTDVESQVPVTSAEDCVRTILSCTVGLLVDAIVPFHVPAMFVALAAPTEIAVGAVELPPHAVTLTMRQSVSAKRIGPSVTVISVLLLTVLSRSGAARTGE